MIEMHSPGSGETAAGAQHLLLKKALTTLQTHATMANLIGALGGISAIFCLLALPELWGIRLSLYLALFIWILLRPRVALYLLPVAIAWGSLDSIDVGGLSLNSADLLVLFLAISWLTSFALRPTAALATLRSGPLDHEQLNTPRYLLYAMLALLFAMLLSMITALSISASMKEITKWLEAAVVLLLGIQYVRTRRQVWTLVVMLCLAAISQAFLGYIQNFFNLGPENFVRDTGLRVYGTFGQPNPYAGYINIALCIALALTLLGRNWMTCILAGCTTVLLLSASLLSQSRGGFIALAVAVLFIMIVGIALVRTLMRGGFIIALMIIGAYLAGLLPEGFVKPVLSRLGLIGISLTAPSTDAFSTAERLAHWLAGWSMFLAHPLLGVGIGNYADAYPQYSIGVFTNPLGHAHNYYINIAAEAGILGLLAFLLLLLATFVAGGRSYQAINKRYRQIQAQRAKPRPGLAPETVRATLEQLGRLKNDRALALGLLAALLSICIHNVLDNLYVHSMTMLFTLLLVMLIRLEDITPKIEKHGGRCDYKQRGE